jgi:hypothetical protein
MTGGLDLYSAQVEQFCSYNATASTVDKTNLAR